MKVMLVILGIVLVVAIVVVAGCRILTSRSTEATVALTAKLPGKVAVVYYSQSKVGNTATVAKWIAKHTGGELVPIEAVEAYPDAYGETLKAAEKDMENGGTRAIKSVPPLDGYDVVFIGSPIWYGTYAPPVAEFFKTHSFAGKTVVPFCTHGGGGSGRYFVDVRKACPAATVKEGLTIRGSNQVERRLGTGVTVHHTEDDVVNWLNAVFAATAASGELKPDGEEVVESGWFDREHLPEIPRHGSIARTMLDAWVAESRKEGSADNENRKVSDL